jgi:hypothetical protein
MKILEPQTCITLLPYISTQMFSTQHPYSNFPKQFDEHTFPASYSIGSEQLHAALEPQFEHVFCVPLNVRVIVEW